MGRRNNKSEDDGNNIAVVGENNTTAKTPHHVGMSQRGQLPRHRELTGNDCAPSKNTQCSGFKRRLPVETVYPRASVSASHAPPIDGFVKLWHLAHGRTTSCPSGRPVFQYNKPHSTPSRLPTALCSTTKPHRRRPRPAADFQAASPFNMASMNCSPTFLMSLRLDASAP